MAGDVQHNTLGGADLHPPQGKDPTPLDLVKNLASAYLIRWDSDGLGALRDVFRVRSTDGAERVEVGNATDVWPLRIINAPLQVPAIATPATPSSGFGSFYAKSDKKPYFLSDTGVETDLTAGGGGVAPDSDQNILAVEVFGSR